MKRSKAKRVWFFLAAGFLWMLVGCGSAIAVSQQEAISPAVQKTPGDSPEKQRPGSWEIDYVLSGGFAGVRRELRLSSSGALKADDLKRKKSIELRASPEQLADVANTLAKMDFSRAPEARSRFSSRCADCFEHSVILVIDGQEHSLHYTDVSLSGSEHAALISLLSSLLDQALLKMLDNR